MTEMKIDAKISIMIVVVVFIIAYCTFLVFSPGEVSIEDLSPHLPEDPIVDEIVELEFYYHPGGSGILDPSIPFVLVDLTGEVDVLIPRIYNTGPTYGLVENATTGEFIRYLNHTEER